VGDLAGHVKPRLPEKHHRYIREHLEDMPEVRDWTSPAR
jgi:phosphoketolase